MTVFENSEMTVMVADEIAKDPAVTLKIHASELRWWATEETKPPRPTTRLGYLEHKIEVDAGERTWTISFVKESTKLLTIEVVLEEKTFTVRVFGQWGIELARPLLHTAV